MLLFVDQKYLRNIPKVVNVFAILSAAALVFVVLRVFWLAVAKLRKFNTITSRECIFFHTQLGQYAACLLLGNLMTSIAGLMGLPWLLQKGITDGDVSRPTPVHEILIIILGGMCRSQGKSRQYLIEIINLTWA